MNTIIFLVQSRSLRHKSQWFNETAFADEQTAEKERDRLTKEDKSYYEYRVVHLPFYEK